MENSINLKFLKKEIDMNSIVPIKKMESESYGDLFSRELGEVDFSKVGAGVDEFLSWVETYHPKNYFKRFFGFKKGEGDNVVYFSVFEEDNLDWFKENKEWIENLTNKGSRESFTRTKKLPIAEDIQLLLVWFENSQKYLSDRWLEDNAEYVKSLNEKIENNKQFPPESKPKNKSKVFR